jgi:murein L,D-transpeptidase YafK
VSRSRVSRRSLVAGLLLAPCVRRAHARERADGQQRIEADRILVIKSARQLHLLLRGSIVRSYPIRLGPNPVGPKIFELDGRTPEGEYVIDSRMRNSRYYRSLHISYPNAEDRARAAKYGISPGGNIRIHGTPQESGRYLGDWTDGCIAVSNEAMREIWDAVRIGTPIEIRP